jgi:hypothetical protein
MAASVNAELLALSGPRSPYPGKLGVVREGALADLLLVDGDPIAQLRLIEDPEPAGLGAVEEPEGAALPLALPDAGEIGVADQVVRRRRVAYRRLPWDTPAGAAVRPPSTTYCAPVMLLARSEHRNSTRFATSSAVP